MSSNLLEIVLAEDDEGHAQLVRRNLLRAGVSNEITHLSDGQRVLDYVRCEGEFAHKKKNGSVILLLDINMPKVDGTEVLRQLKQNEATAQIPVIMLTTTDDPREIQKCYELGCSVYITKPVAYPEFIEAVQRLGLFLAIVQLPPYDDRLSALESARGAKW